ncbi:MAG: MATE family efflux transporter [Candidatus Kapabacteria bacterium]|nr:MATE family efflux transporter [Candidatus Kapabacteria bacterium]
MSRSKDFRETLSLAMPVAASYVSDMLTLAADSIMVGSLGAVPLAAVTLAGSSSMIVMLFGIGFTVAITPIAAMAWGKGDHSHCAGVARTGTQISLVVSVVLVALLIGVSPFLGVLGAPADVTALSIPYFRWLVLSFFFRLTFGAFKQTTEAMGNTRLPMLIAIGANVLNVGLNWVFIWGNLGMPEMGVEGAGFATFLSRMFSAVIALWAWRRLSYFSPLRAHSKARASKSDRRLLWMSGASIGLQITLEVLAFAAGAIMIGWIGATQLAAHQIAINLASITFMVALGLSTAATIRIASAHGMSDAPGVRRAASSAIFLVLGYELITVLCFTTLRFWLPTLYVADSAVIALAAHLLLYAAAFQLFDGMQAVGMGLLRGMNDTRVPTIISFASYTLITMPAGYYCAFHLGMGASGIWVGYLAGLVIASVGYFARFRYITKKGLA